MRNKLYALLVTSAFLISLGTLGIAEPFRPPIPPSPGAQTQAAAGQDDPWRTAKSNITQKTQIPAGGPGLAISQTANQTGQMQDQIYQVQGTKDQVAAQVEANTVQTMQQGASQTQQVAEQLRRNTTSVAQDIQSSVSSTKTG